MEEASTVADPPVPTPAVDPKSEDAVGSDTLPPPTRNQNHPPKPEIKEEEQKPAEDSEAQTEKRKLDHLHGVCAPRKSTYFKIRSIIKDLRPFFIEVIQALDFKEIKASHDIREWMKTMLELTRQLRSEASLAKPKKPEEQPLEGASKNEKYKERENNMPQPQNSEVSSLPDNAMEGEKVPEVKEFAKQLEEGIQGTFIIGGSPVGWNFLVYLSSKPIYHGVTKASFRSRQAA